jgi:hypothetical protein
MFTLMQLVYIHNFSPIRDISRREAGHIGKLFAKCLLFFELITRSNSHTAFRRAGRYICACMHNAYDITQVGEEQR